MLTIITLVAVQATADAPHHPWGWLWIPFALLVLGAVVASVGYLLFRVMPPWRPSGVTWARDILPQRLARGEICTEEYDDRLSPLS